VEYESAKKSAAAVWVTSGLPEGPEAIVEEARVERIVADITQTAGAPSDDAGLPF